LNFFFARKWCASIERFMFEEQMTATDKLLTKVIAVELVEKVKRGNLDKFGVFGVGGFD
jgi:hypothetical protein